MKENYLIVENANESELESILMDFANLYRDSEFTKGIQLYRKKENPDSFLILFTIQPDFTKFNYVVNYIKYPANFEKFNPYIRGFYNTSNISEKHNFKSGDWLMVYISENDKTYDNVNFVNDQNQSYLYDFGGNIKKLETTEENFQLIEFDKNNYYHSTDIVPSKQPETALKPWWKFW